MMAALGAGIVSEESLSSLRKVEKEFTPLISPEERKNLTDRWKKAVYTTQKYEF
jgi:glycerol kinase